nr:alpha/beta hydrolase [Chthonobacter rhizosphaerae]
MAAYAALSRETRASLPMVADVAYGDGPEEKLDLFLPDSSDGARPVHLFVHGGYWRMFSKEDFSFVARTVTAAGAIAAVMDYALMPNVRMATIVDQVRRAATWLHANTGLYGGDPDRLTVGGHSAGAHLCTFLLRAGKAAPPVRGAFLLSGVYDLAPLQASFLAPLIALTDEEVRSFTPLTQSHATGAAVHILVGDEETAPFHDQAAALDERLARDGLHVTRTLLARTNHMSAVLNLSDPDTDAGRSLSGLITGSA